ncbi:MAG: hypothetical protein LBI19_06920 [Oscillospiraceae bacterium]|nr:hypothetical protein [Oscillospiraceae bacterium]
MKGIILPAAPDDFVIAEPFRHGLPNDELIAGINAFRTFLCELFDRLAAEKDRFDPRKAALYDPENGEESLWKCFPVTKDLAALLFFIGLHGKLETEPNVELAVYGADLLEVPKPKSEKFYGLRKLSGKRLSELFEFLSEMSFYFEDFDYLDRVDLSKTGPFYISYENDNDLMIGLKLMAEAQANIMAEHYRLDSAFMRCDFHPLADTEPIKHQIRLIDCVDTQPPELQRWLIELDGLLLSNGCLATGEKSGDIIFAYTSKKSKKWVCKFYFGVTGYRIRPNVDFIRRANSAAWELPETMLRVLRDKCCTSCYGGQPCTHGGAFMFTQNGEDFAGCRSPHHEGYKFTLENAEDREAIMKWIGLELGIHRA